MTDAEREHVKKVAECALDERVRVTRIQYKGVDYLLLGTRAHYWSPIVLEEEYVKGGPSAAILSGNDIMQHGQVVGHISEIQWGEEIDPPEPTPEAFGVVVDRLLGALRNLVKGDSK